MHGARWTKVAPQVRHLKRFTFNEMITRFPRIGRSRYLCFRVPYLIGLPDVRQLGAITSSLYGLGFDEVRLAVLIYSLADSDQAGKV